MHGFVRLVCYMLATFQLKYCNKVSIIIINIIIIIIIIIIICLRHAPFLRENRICFSVIYRVNLSRVAKYAVNIGHHIFCKLVMILNSYHLIKETFMSSKYFN